MIFEKTAIEGVYLIKSRIPMSAAFLRAALPLKILPLQDLSLAFLSAITPITS